jgi:hypothetical protein
MRVGKPDDGVEIHDISLQKLMGQKWGEMVPGEGGLFGGK